MMLVRTFLPIAEAAAAQVAAAARRAWRRRDGRLARPLALERGRDQLHARQRPGEVAEHVGRGERLGKDRIGTGLDVELRPRDGYAKLGVNSE